MFVKLSSCGNPDYGQNPYEEFFGCEADHTVEVQSLEEASEVCKRFIDKNELGGGNWSGGQVYDRDQHIADISYNGRIWPVE